MSIHHLITDIDNSYLRYMMDELRQDMRQEMREKVLCLWSNQTNIQSSIVEVKDDIKELKCDLLILKEQMHTVIGVLLKNEESRYPCERSPPSAQTRSSGRNGHVAMNGDSMTSLRSRGSCKGKICMICQFICLISKIIL